jgi:hypothetical protein
MTREALAFRFETNTFVDFGDTNNEEPGEEWCQLCAASHARLFGA